MRIDTQTQERFRRYLQEQEYSQATVAKYMHDVGQLAAFCGRCGKNDKTGSLNRAPSSRW